MASTGAPPAFKAVQSACRRLLPSEACCVMKVCPENVDLKLPRNDILGDQSANKDKDNRGPQMLLFI